MMSSSRAVEHVIAMDIMRTDAQYQEDITGDHQKLLLADIVVPRAPYLGAVWDKDWGKW